VFGVIWTYPIQFFERWFHSTAALLALSLILDVQQYASGVGQGKSLAFEAKLRAQKRSNVIPALSRYPEKNFHELQVRSAPTGRDFASLNRK